MSLEQIAKTLQDADEVIDQLIQLASNLAVLSVCKKCHRPWYDDVEPILGDCLNPYHQDGDKALRLWQKLCKPFEGPDAP